VYCPSFLPGGFVLQDLEFGEVAGAHKPPQSPGALRAVFTRESPKGRIEFIQGRPGLSVITELRTSSGELLGNTLYDGFVGNLFETAVLARSPDGFTHTISVEGLTTDDLKQIAAAMTLVSP